MVIRIKCPACGRLLERENTLLAVCPNCKADLKTEQLGTLQLYRMGNPVGCAVSYGIYIDGEPFGYIANKSSVRLYLPHGAHTLHLRVKGQPTKTVPVEFALRPEAPDSFWKVRIKVGMWKNSLLLEPSEPSAMPND